MEKHIDQFGYLPELNGMLTVNLVGGSVQDFQKIAADYAYRYSDDMLEAIERFKKDLKPTEILATVIGLGAGEFYSSNVNGDYFTEETLLRIFKTFEEGLLYQHHINRDPALSLGLIKFATYNTKMHRVELLIAPDRSRAGDWVGAIERGEVVDVSFGYRTPFDICSICRNKAGSRNEYCIHLKNQMNQIIPDGRKVFAINPDVGRFFELSFVSKGAVPIAKIMQKVAAMIPNQEFTRFSAVEDQVQVKVAEVKEETDKLAEIKLAEFIKNIESNITHSGIDPKLLKAIAIVGVPFSEKYEREIEPRIFNNYGIDEILGTLPVSGIMLRLSELVNIVSNRVDELKNVVDKLKSGDYSYKEDSDVDYDDLYYNRPRFRFNKSLFDLLSERGYIRDRSWFLGPLLNRLIEMDFVGPEEYSSRLEKVSYDVRQPNDAGVLVAGLASYLYAKHFLNIGPTKLTGLSSIVARHPSVLPAIILGIGFAANAMRRTGKDLTPEYYINGEMVTPDRLVKQSSTKDGLEKISKVMTRWILPFTAGQLGSAYLKTKRDYGGEQLSKPFEFWANNPFLSSALLMGGANILGRTLSNFPKRASDDSFDKESALALSNIVAPFTYKTTQLMGPQLIGTAADLFAIGKIIDIMAGKGPKRSIKDFNNRNIKIMIPDESKGGI